MKKLKKFVVLLACAGVLVSCDSSSNKDEGVDYSTDFGLYFYGNDTNDLKRYNPDSITDNYFSKDKPTILFFHGWQPGIDQNMTKIDFLFETSTDAVKKGIPYVDYAKELKEDGYNVGLMWWAKYSDLLNTLFEKVWVEFLDGESIAYKFATEYAECFKDYDQEVSFMGHSFGGQTSTATSYMLYKMKENNEIGSDVTLPSRLTFADPYIGDFALFGGEAILQEKIYHFDEEINGRSAAELVADCCVYLHDQGLTIDSYNAVFNVYDDYSADDPAKKAEIKNKLLKSTCWTVLEGMQEEYGDNLISGLHLLALDWVSLSYFETKEEENTYFPTAGLPTEKMKTLVGKEFVTEYHGVDLEKETFTEIAK